MDNHLGRIAFREMFGQSIEKNASYGQANIKRGGTLYLERVREVLRGQNLCLENK